MTLQTRLMITVIGFVALILIASAIAIGTTVGRVLISTLEADLRTSAQHIQLLQPGYPPSVRTAEEALSNSPNTRGLLLVVVDQDGTVSGGVVGDDGDVESLSDEQIAQLQEDMAAKDFSTISIEGFGSYRVAPIDAGQDISGVAGLPLASLNSTVGQIVWTILLVTAAGLVVLGIALALVIRRSLRPLRVVADTATRVAQLPLSEGAVNITERVAEAEADPDTETGRVGAALNTLLDHVDTSLAARARNEERMRVFVADASHELRTPLASIRGYSELSLKALSTQTPAVAADTAGASLERIQAQSLRMTSLVEDLLLLARLDEGTELVPGVVDLTRLAVEAISDARVAGCEHEWVLDVPDAPVEIVGDASRLHQVIGNLLTNARLHTPDGTTVELSVAVEGTDAVVRVRDNGPGISPELQASLFERFARGDASRARKSGGTGLGLSIAKAVVDGHHGQLGVTSEPGATVFEVRLPHRRSDANTPGAATDTPADDQTASVTTHHG